ncbi:MAG: beta-glucosidase [Deltaproteobacteria bacterium]|nr:beta-glucosidase [Deltaproteobacteria bacterium]
MTTHPFPAGFLWGTATSAFQIEGAHDQAGRRPSIWDRFADTPGKIEDGSDARVACDHFHRWRDDLAILRDLGVGAYRFSVAWPRIKPHGRGATNDRGLDFYDRLVDALLAAHIAPFVTLYHWDLPQELEDEGGWAARSTVDAFVAYADVVARRLGDRVRHWVTHNEPWCIATLGYEQGDHAPGHKDPVRALRAAHHVLLSHGRTVPVLRHHSPGSQVGIVLNLVPAEPATESAEDQDATRWFDGFFNRWYLDPLYRGGYPEDAIDDRVQQGHLPDGELPFVMPGDLAAIRTPTDFLGVNYYSPAILRGEPATDGGAPRRIQVVADAPRTDMGWEVRPSALHTLLLRLHREYQVPKIYITENGCAYDDPIGADGQIHDARRIAYLTGHLVALSRAIALGAPVAGYFHWSLLDNFEWGHGYTKRFGLVHVDYATQQRTPRASASVYRTIVTANAVDSSTSP